MSRGTPVLVELEDGESHEFIVVPQIRGRSLADLLAEYGFALNTRCGQRGLCDGCEVHLREGKLTIGQSIVAAPAAVRACQARIAERVTLLIPRRSQIQHWPQVSDTFRIDITCAHQPLFDLGAPWYQHRHTLRNPCLASPH